MAIPVRILPVLAALALFAAGAHASPTQLSVFEDDHVLLDSGPAARAVALDEIQALGATTVRVLVNWSRLAPATTAKRRPAVDLDDPASYGDWSSLDDIVAGAAGRGLTVLLTPTGPGPRWASQCARPPANRPGICMPRVSDFAHFVHALGVRYPGVTAWSFWNEPNHKSSLFPQVIRGRYVGAQRYRALALAAFAALRATGHTRDLLLLGETAPVGGSRAIPPLDFYKALLCMTCRSRPHFAISGIAHHPYTSGAIAGPAFVGSRGDVTISSLGRLTRLLDRAARLGIVPRRTPLYLTEFGFQTRPPDPFGVTLARQAEYLNWADWIAYRNPRVAAVGQYELRDDPTPGGFNTGLRFASGKPKPALAAYALPIWVARSGPAHVRVFGLARSAHTLPATVEIQAASTRKGRFATVATVTTSAHGYFVTRLRNAGSYWRLALVDVPRTRFSRIANAR